jgi:hypothetical protein
MINTIRDCFADDVEYFTDTELAYIIGYERIPMDQLCESETLWKLRSWGKYEDYLDAVELIFGEDEDCDIFNEDFYRQDPEDQQNQAKVMLQQAGYPTLLTNDYFVWVKRTDWK